MIEKEVREKNGGITLMILKNESCRLKLVAIDGNWETGKLEHLKEITYAPNGLVAWTDDAGWELLLMLPAMYISEREISRLTKAISDMMSFLIEAKPLLK